VKGEEEFDELEKIKRELIAEKQRRKQAEEEKYQFSFIQQQEIIKTQKQLIDALTSPQQLFEQEKEFTISKPLILKEDQSSLKEEKIYYKNYFSKI